MASKKVIRVVRRTPRGEPDKPISFWHLVGSFVGILSLGGSLAVWSVNMIVQKANTETRDMLRAEALTRERELWSRFPSKSEWQARREEIDRQLKDLAAHDDQFRNEMSSINLSILNQTTILERLKTLQEEAARRGTR